MAILVGCRLSPLTNRIEVGEEPFVVFVGEGPGGVTDLFASSAAGGEVIQFTFSREREFAPALGPSGSMVAFLRSTAGAEPSVYLVVMNLLNAAEREDRVPPVAGTPRRVAWSRDGRSLFLGADAGVFMTPAPPDVLDLAPLVAGSPAAAEADSALSVAIGDPPFGRIVDCEAGDAFPAEGRTLCVEIPGRQQAELVVGARDPLRWGSDSVGYQVGGTLVVRPLGGGRPRRLQWTRPPANPREVTHFGGRGGAP